MIGATVARGAACWRGNGPTDSAVTVANKNPTAVVAKTRLNVRAFICGTLPMFWGDQISEDY